MEKSLSAELCKELLKKVVEEQCREVSAQVLRELKIREEMLTRLERLVSLCQLLSGISDLSLLPQGL